MKHHFGDENRCTCCATSKFRHSDRHDNKITVVAPVDVDIASRWESHKMRLLLVRETIELNCKIIRGFTESACRYETVHFLQSEAAVIGHPVAMTVEGWEHFRLLHSKH